jgi:hypothetical protein
MISWTKDQTIQAELSEVRKTEDPYVCYGCISVTRISVKTFRLAFFDQAKEKFSKMSSAELLFYLSTIFEATEVDIISNSCGKTIQVRDYFAFKFLVETMISLLQERNMGNAISAVESTGRYGIAKGSSGDSV